MRINLIFAIMALFSNTAFSSPIYINNAGFENSPAPEGGYTNNIQGWNVISGDIHLIDYDYAGINNHSLSRIDGDQFLDLNGFNPGTIEQQIPISVGSSSTASFSFFHGAWSSTTGNASFRVTLTANNSGPISQTFTSLQGQNWISRSLSLALTSLDTLLTVRFTSLQTGSPSWYGAAIDKVSLDITPNELESSSSVPSPSSLWLLIGVLGIGLYGKLNMSQRIDRR